MAQPYATGAVHVFVDDETGSPVYFGTTESYPDDQRQPEYEMVMNDVSGSKVPLDLAWEGETAQISLVMTRWSETVALLLETKPYSFGFIPGLWSWNDMGSLIGLEGYAHQLWLVYTFGGSIANKQVYTSKGLPRGRYYPQCVVWAPETDEKGTKPMKRHFLFFAWPEIDVQNRRFKLYSTADSDFTGINANMIT